MTRKFLLLFGNLLISLKDMAKVEESQRVTRLSLNLSTFALLCKNYAGEVTVCLLYILNEVCNSLLKSILINYVTVILISGCLPSRYTIRYVAQTPQVSYFVSTDMQTGEICNNTSFQYKIHLSKPWKFLQYLVFVE